MKGYKLRAVYLFSMIFLFSCDPNPAKEKKQLPVKSKKEYQELMINSHKAYLKKEKMLLDQYTDSLPYNFIEKRSGLRYCILETENSGDSVKAGDIAVIEYTLMLLNGDIAYQTLKDKPQEFMVNMDDVEAGLHEGIQELAVGDRAILILPAHLAHGITGDQAAIPYQSPLVYHLTLLAKK
jgi:FKBP-type peptidyl-prolyl cis-trans isomerase